MTALLSRAAEFGRTTARPKPEEVIAMRLLRELPGMIRLLQMLPTDLRKEYCSLLSSSCDEVRAKQVLDHVTRESTR